MGRVIFLTPKLEVPIYLYNPSNYVFLFSEMDDNKETKVKRAESPNSSIFTANSSPETTQEILPDTPKTSSIKQLSHELRLARENNVFASKHALDVLEENKCLIDENALLKTAIQEAQRKIRDLVDDKEQLENSLEVARQQRNNVSEIGHNREIKLQEKICNLEQECDQIKNSSSSIQAIETGFKILIFRM